MSTENKPEPLRYLEISKATLFAALRAILRKELVQDYYLTDLIRLEPRERGEIGRGDYLIRLAYNFYKDVVKPEPPKGAFLYLTEEEAATLLNGLEKLDAAERGIGTGGIYDRLKEEFPQL